MANLLIGLLAGILAGFLIAYIIFGSARREVAVLSSRLKEKEGAYLTLLQEKEEANKRILEERQTAYQRQLEAQRRMSEESLAKLKENFDTTVQGLKSEMAAVTEKMLKERQSEFQVSSRATLESLTTPLNQQIEEMKKAVQANTDKHAQLGGELSENIRQVLEQSNAACRSADHLASVLKGGGKLQGDFGELVLENLLKNQNMQEGIHYDKQEQLADSEGKKHVSESGKKLQPDLVLHLDTERHVVVDSKVSLTAYIKYTEADTEEVKEAELKKHVKSLEAHVQELVRKGYHDYSYKGHEPIGFVIMFVPFSGALRAALREDAELWRNAMAQNVYIADEETIFAVLKILALTWKENDRAKNHQEVYKIADEIVLRIQAFINHFKKIGEELEKARNAYDVASKKLQERGQSITQSCNKLVELGAKQKK